MKFILKILVRIGINAFTLYLAARFINGVQISSVWSELFFVGFWLGMANFFLKPLLKLISLPLIILSLGLFTILINTAMLLLVDYFSPALTVLGFWPAVKTVLLLGVVNFFFSKTFLKN